ncbi:DHA2 family efflux MFS transporter permease subunit [Streptomyces sp. AC536]|uniref:DHA2 family efflux MFS transporter permease subunit n=1 Tax=Streptomyces buecherae TaxID=2763006 RepID=UPI00164D78C0|nr:DHA2 family efflux MFS transporter permease subunit [Streptomyces buecherae]MBC3982344.1 DHA2 family efflux MFS transporter permease subunit [Streptomyces buecherae]QNJ43287.1 DHA2 family efflux MFS transporter permease subunit [Streptomyces buecherae]
MSPRAVSRVFTKVGAKGVPAAPRAGGAAPPWLLMLLSCGAQFLVVLDATIVSVALPPIAAALGFTTSSVGWVVNAYTLAFAGFLLLGGRLADLIGTRAVFLTGLGIFTAASLWCGLATAPWHLVLARAVQGLGGALLMPTTLTIVHLAYADPAGRARALGLWSMVGAVGAAAGTVFGGLLTDSLGWRWVFLVKVPIGVAVLVVAWRALARRPRTDAAREPLDVLGALLVTCGLAALVYGVVAFGEPAGTARAVAFSAAAVVLLALFVARQHRWARSPLMPLRIFGHRAVSAANAVMFCLGVGYLASPVVLSLYLQHVLDYSPSRAGLGFLPTALAVMVGAQVTGWMTTHWGTRRTASLGLSLVTAGFLLLVRLGPDTSFLPTIVVPLLLVGLGAGVAFTPITVAATSSVEPALTGLASGLLNTTRQVSTALGIAVLTAVAGALGGAHGYGVAFLIAGLLAALATAGAATLLPRERG